MYEYITGRIETLTPASVVVEAAGVGYFLNISLQTFSQIGSRTEVKLYTHFAPQLNALLLPDSKNIVVYTVQNSIKH